MLGYRSIGACDSAFRELGVVSADVAESTLATDRASMSTLADAVAVCPLSSETLHVIATGPAPEPAVVNVAVGPLPLIVPPDAWNR
jgi:hypothetical protein